MTKIAVIGAGAWGTALAMVGARSGCTVGLWAHEPETVTSIRDRGQNMLFLPGFDIDNKIVATNSVKEAVAGAELVLLATPAQHVGSASAVLANLDEQPPAIICAKGIDCESGRLMTEVGR